MSCNCKRKIDIEEQFGEPMDENLFEKLSRFMKRITVFIIFLGLALILIPTIVIIAMYKLVFSKNPTISMPKFLGKYFK